MNSMTRLVLVATTLGLTTGAVLVGMMHFGGSRGPKDLWPMFALAVLGPFVLRHLGLGWQLRALFPAYLAACLAMFGCTGLYAWLVLWQRPGHPDAGWFEFLQIATIPSLAGAWIFAGLVRLLYLVQAKARRALVDIPA